jgi:hypothetical protein
VRVLPNEVHQVMATQLLTLDRQEQWRPIPQPRRDQVVVPNRFRVPPLPNHLEGAWAVRVLPNEVHQVMATQLLTLDRQEQ